MEFLYLSPEFPPNYSNFILQLASHGAAVWALGEAQFYDLPEPVRQAIRYYVRTDLGSKAAVENALTQLMAAKRRLGAPPRFEVVESHNETWLALEAHINQILRVPGIRPPDLEPLKKKSAMKRLFASCGLPTARGRRVESPAQGLDLAGEIGFPLILKPDEGVGAGSIHKVTRPEELQGILPRLAGDYFMEEFVEAPIVSYDGLVDYEGNLLFESSLTYGDGVLDYVLGKDTFFYVEREIPGLLRATGRRLVHAFKIRRKFFHFEFFAAEGAYMPIEINCRPPGGAILDMMNYSADVDLYAAYARMITGRRAPDAAKAKKYYCAYVGRRDRDYLHSHHRLLQRLGSALVEFGENPVIFQQAMSRFRYIVRSVDREGLLQMARDIQLTRD